MLSHLKEGHRTIVFKQTSADDGGAVKKAIAFWYIRLRSGLGLESPLQGIVKVDWHHTADHL